MYRSIIIGFLLMFLTLATPIAAQSIVAVTPDTATRGTSLWVNITGSQTHFGQSATYAWLQRGSAYLWADTVRINSYYSMDAHFSIPASTPAGLWDL